MTKQPDPNKLPPEDVAKILDNIGSKPIIEGNRVVDFGKRYEWAEVSDQPEKGKM